MWLLCGASHMGKTYLSREVLAYEFGLVHRLVDRVYQRALIEADMATPTPTGAVENRRARKLARERRWPDDGARAVFFASYRKQVRKLLRDGREQASPVVLEGGTLRLREEASLALSCLVGLHGQASRAIRVTVVLTYEEWLRNRVNRASSAGVETIEVARITPEVYENKIREAEPEPLEGIEDHRIGSADELRKLAEAIRSQTVSADATA